jgi:hypothetical protein
LVIHQLRPRLPRLPQRPRAGGHPSRSPLAPISSVMA